MEYVWVVVGWILLNIVAKLFTNSLDRVYGEKIDDIVASSPSGIAAVLWGLFRAFLIVFFMPAFLATTIIPKSLRHRTYFEYLYDLRRAILTKNFSRQRIYLLFFFTHPLLWFGLKDASDYRERLERLSKTNKLMVRGTKKS
ncbi:MAG TPA: hypothetical protein VLX12_00215 [Syntrophorhabdales bacterium]|nr:hypothetical protein [Syntrophorhabdales bacterium]